MFLRLCFLCFLCVLPLIWAGCPEPTGEEPPPVEPEGPAMGTENGPCGPDGECFGDLTCASDVCVDLGGGDGNTDGSTPTDAGSADGSGEGTTDGTVSVDAGSSDGSGEGTTDGTEVIDSGSSDGTTDGAEVIDSGSSDGASDGSSAEDAGNVAADAGVEPECRASCEYGQICNENDICVDHPVIDYLCDECDPLDIFACSGDLSTVCFTRFTGIRCEMDVTPCLQYPGTACEERICYSNVDCFPGDTCGELDEFTSMGTCSAGECKRSYCSATSCSASNPCPWGYNCVGGFFSYTPEPCVEDSDCSDLSPVCFSGQCAFSTFCELAEELICAAEGGAVAP